MIRVLVLDLDGTLADTAEITTGTRLPAHVLSLSKPSEFNPSLLIHGDLKRQINCLIGSGLGVYVITRAPKSYASTLIFLLGIDFHALIPSTKRFPSIESKLEYIIETESVSPSEVLYVGNEVSDESAAKTVGIYYQDIDEVYEMRDNYRTHLQDIIKLCESADISESKSAKIIAQRQQSNISKSIDIMERVENGSALSDTEYSQVFLANPLDDKFLRNDILEPFINPSFISRFEYDTDYEVRKRLFNFLINLGFTCKLIKTPFTIPNYFDEVLVYSHYKYDDMSHWWTTIKNWSYPNSGPKPELLHLEFIALSMAAFLDKIDFPFVLVPVPSTEFSAQKPAETSLRLAHRVSQLSGAPIFDMFKKNSEGEISSKYPNLKFQRSVFLLDDQLTKGDNAIQCLNILANKYVLDVRVHTWTSKHFDVVEEYDEV